MALLPRKKNRYQIQTPLTSLIDIVFMLLIYFLLTTNFMVDEGIKIKLPQARAAAPQTQTGNHRSRGPGGQGLYSGSGSPLGPAF